MLSNAIAYEASRALFEGQRGFFLAHPDWLAPPSGHATAVTHDVHRASNTMTLQAPLRRGRKP